MRGLGFLLFFVILFVFVALAFVSPFLAQRGYDVKDIHKYYSLFCHQLNSRSYCVFSSSIDDCTADSSILSREETIEVLKRGEIGYKFPICARDVGIYSGMLISAFTLLLTGDWKRREVPEVWFYIFAIAPLAIDGSLQFIGLYESSNFVRLITGFMAGNASTYYLGPLFNILISKVLPE